MFDEAFANSYWHSIKPYTCIASKIQHCIDRKSWLSGTSWCMPHHYWERFGLDCAVTYATA